MTTIKNNKVGARKFFFAILNLSIGKTGKKVSSNQITKINIPNMTNKKNTLSFFFSSIRETKESSPKPANIAKEKEKRTIILEGILDAKTGICEAIKRICNGDSMEKQIVNIAIKKKKRVECLNFIVRMLIKPSSNGIIPIKLDHSAYVPYQSFLVTGLP